MVKPKSKCTVANVLVFAFVAYANSNAQPKAAPSVSVSAAVNPIGEYECAVDLTIRNKTDAPLTFSNLQTSFYDGGMLVLGTTHYRVSLDVVNVAYTQQNGQKPQTIASKFTITAPPQRDRRLQVNIDSLFCRSGNRRMSTTMLLPDGRIIGPLKVEIESPTAKH